MHFSTTLFGFLALWAAFPGGVSASHSHQRFHRRYTQVDGVVPTEVTPARVETAVVEPAHVEPATVEGPPNNAVVDVSTPPDNALVTPTSIATDVASNQTLVPTTLATVVKVSGGSTLLTSLPAPLPTSEVYIVPTTGGTPDVSPGDGFAPTTTSTTGKVVSSTSLAIVTSSVITTESTGVIRSTGGGPISNSSSTSSSCTPTAIDTPSISPSTGMNTTTTSFSTLASSATTSPITSNPPTNTTITSPSSFSDFVTTASTSTPTTAFSSSTKPSFKHSTPAAPTPTTTYRLTLAIPSATPAASQSKGLSMAEFNKTKPCFDKKCDDPGSEMTYNKTVTFHADQGGDGGIRLGRGPGVASAATGGRDDWALRMGVAVVVVGISAVLAVL